MVEWFVGKDAARAGCGAEGANDRMVSGAGRGFRDEARIQGDLVGVVEVVVSPPLLGRLHGRRFLGYRWHVLLGRNIEGDGRRATLFFRDEVGCNYFSRWPSKGVVVRMLAEKAAAWTVDGESLKSSS
jgi:hypothetical protein